MKNTATAQAIPDSMVNDLTSMNDSTLLSQHSLIHIDSVGKANPEGYDQLLFVPYGPKKFKKTPAFSLACILHPFYFRFACVNNSDSTREFYFHPGLMYTRIDLYNISGKAILQSFPKDSNVARFQYFRLGPHEKMELLAVLQQDRSGATGLNPMIISKKYLGIFRDTLYAENTDQRMSGLVFSGALLMMVLFMGTNYLLNRKKEYLYNSIYSACMCAMVFLYAIFSKQTTLFTSFLYSYLDLVLQIVGTIFYIAFTRKFLNTKENYPFLNRLFRAEEWILFGMLVLYTIVHFFTVYVRLEDWIELSMKFLLIALGIVYIFVAFRQRNKLLNYIAMGNAVLLFFGCCSLWLVINPPNGKTTSFFNSALFFYEVGIVLELIFFLYGLAYKNRTELIERTRMEEAIKLETEKQVFEKQLAILHAQQEERNRISRDMHDDLGSGMTAIRLYSELAKKKIPGSVPEIEKISSSADELINKMNTIIWTMSSSNDTLGNLVSYIRSYALEYLEDKGIDCQISIDNKHPNIPVPGAARRNVFMIVKETLNNILKHAKASKVTINYSEMPGLFKLTIQDNGVGIDMDNLREFGNGLKNMKQRAESIGCTYSISNNNGTCTTLEYKFDPTTQGINA